MHTQNLDVKLAYLFVLFASKIQNNYCCWLDIVFIICFYFYVYYRYKTRRLCTLWAHNQVNHTNDVTTVLNSNSACCICENILSKRTQLLKHVDKCLVKPAAEQKDCEEKTNDEQGNKGKDHSPTSLSVGKIACSRCKTCFSTYKLHHKHVLECALKNVLTRQ